MTTAIETVTLTTVTGNLLHLEPVDRVTKVVDDGAHRTVTVFPGRAYRLYNREIPEGQPFEVRVKESVREVMALTGVQPTITVGPLPVGEYSNYDGNLVLSDALSWEQQKELVLAAIERLRSVGDLDAASDLETAAVVRFPTPQTGRLDTCPAYCAVHTPGGFVAAGVLDEEAPLHTSSEWPSGITVGSLGEDAPLIDLPQYNDGLTAEEARGLAADLLATAAVLDSAAVKR